MKIEDAAENAWTRPGAKHAGTDRGMKMYDTGGEPDAGCRRIPRSSIQREADQSRLTIRNRGSNVIAMKRRVFHLVALFMASSTMLVGMPLRAASMSSPAWPTDSIAATSPTYDSAGESRGETFEEEREEEVESKIVLLAQRPGSESLDMLCVGKIEQAARLFVTGPQDFLRLIRGPPSA